jgi:predicted flap endonuclease-1-like 5' DNA nuclease
MRRDESIARRNALAIPGWLLIFYSLAAIVYAEHFRSKSDFCSDGTWVLISGTCYTVWKLVAPLLFIGIGLALGGAFGFRAKAQGTEAKLRHGAPTHVLLSLLISLVVVPFVFLMVQLYRQAANDQIYQVELLGVAFEHVFLLQLAILIALLMLAPYVAALIGDCRRRRDALAASAQEPAVPAPLPREAGFVQDDSGPEEDWPASREEEQSPEPEQPRPVAKPAAPKAAKPAATIQAYNVPTAPIEDIEGIGPKYGALLRAVGVDSISELVWQEPEGLAKSSGIGIAHIQTWQAMAEFTAIKGVGPQYAEVLVSSGIADIAELRRRSAASLTKRINAYLGSLDKHIVGTSVTEKRVESWQTGAKGLRKVTRPI